MALTQEDLQAIRAIVKEEVQTEITPIKADIAALKQGQTKLEQGQVDLKDSLQVVRESQITLELEHLPKIKAALDGHKLNSEKLDAIQKNLEDITPTVQALDILHQTGYAK